MLVMAAVSLALRGDATPDVSWLITMCERILNGERAYVDMIQTDRRPCRCSSTCQALSSRNTLAARLKRGRSPLPTPARSDRCG